MERAEEKRGIIPQDKAGGIRDWAEMQGCLPDDITPGDKKYLHSYFRAQIFIVSDKKRKASRLFRHLSNLTGYNEFERNNVELLRCVDVAVKGSTRWSSEETFSW